MEFGSYENTQDKGSSSSKKDTPAPGDTVGEVNAEARITADEVILAGGFGATDDISTILPIARDRTDFEDHLRKVEGYEDSAERLSDPPKNINNNGKDAACEAVNMEASVTSDEVTRAGGFGARDDISSFLPIASDFTDFEANIRDARGYEDLNEEIKRPGLGWSSETNK
ncbi:hypothetical protein ABFS82_10G159800 [Erythranthe guttata]|uniref:Uncharacterized protein n=1 Tax=Erythranthe guttata TaxID=4155 RepID=A0A022PT18_ERYGU|nr:PREDICTED: uncharacterized protein LOC105949414 [Erythranthe guttata]XP_012828175.1 PREDICTED: uncharacterized protein LOC105949414 [Erythranthe guttata]EYU18689.1 hypothetical protein MIMGU_mgv1a015062mg [Erythranthe guttata]|eukprot:XP_012828174.1 PREDICTED: uncharacterized protein LOC105949414 [Erythranthe guttata]